MLGFSMMLDITFVPQSKSIFEDPLKGQKDGYKKSVIFSFMMKKVPQFILSSCQLLLTSMVTCFNG